MILKNVSIFIAFKSKYIFLSHLIFDHILALSYILQKKKKKKTEKKLKIAISRSKSKFQYTKIAMFRKSCKDPSYQKLTFYGKKLLQSDTDTLADRVSDDRRTFQTFFVFFVINFFIDRQSKRKKRHFSELSPLKVKKMLKKRFFFNNIFVNNSL